MSQVGVVLGYFGHLCLALGAVPMGHFLNSSLAQSAAELWLAKVCPERANYAFSEKI